LAVVGVVVDRLEVGRLEVAVGERTGVDRFDLEVGRRTVGKGVV
jgi:hypothetical protein